MLLFSKCQRKLIYHLTAEMQVAVGCVVIKDVTYCKNPLKNANCTLRRRLSIENL